MKILIILSFLVFSSGLPVFKKSPLDEGSTGNSPEMLDNVSFFEQVRQSIELQSIFNFLALVKQEIDQKLDETKARQKEEEEEKKEQSAMAKLLYEPDYEYVNVYDCSIWQVDKPASISNAPYGCLWEASAMYAIYLGEISTANVTLVLGDMDTYNTQYKAYLKEMQDSLFADWGVWFNMNQGKFNYKCGMKQGNDWVTTSLSQCEKTDSSQEHQISIVNVKVENAYIDASMMSHACDSMSKAWKMEFKPSDLDFVTYDTPMEVNRLKKHKKITKYTMANTTAPKIMNIIENPMTNMSKDNVTDISKLVDLLKSNLFNTAGCNLFDISSPIQVFGTVSDIVTNIKVEGQAELDYEKKQREMMILNIILGIVGVLSMVLGPVAGPIAEAAVAAAGDIGDLAINGHLSAVDVILSLTGVFGSCLRGVSRGMKFEEVANTFKFTRSLSSHALLMKNFSHYSETMEEIFGLVYDAQKLNSY